ncbi:multicopper oxidase domain-containing protein [Granulicella sp. dw_53]|uniref:multicopper oxidase family protein n=1 Tax=Granulicella sp. dw_53 TaxID=2719792 RepID=UPI001BD5529E|nr:multicopper oxidase domain-containing protein [Granulicella sp. dw_53]
MREVTRRKFMTLAATVGVAAASGEAEGFSPGPPPTEIPSTFNSAVEVDGMLPVAAPEDFVPDLVLDAAFITKILDGHKVRLRAYNGVIPGPMIETRAGRTLKIRVTNSLTPEANPGWAGDMDVPHEMEHTNLHLHGLDIAPHIFEPLGTSDVGAPMISIAPGQYKDYPFVIPSDQSPGLNWYHPHSHGSTAIQGVSGMAGGLIVKGAIDEVPEIKAAKDYPLVVQDIGLFPTDKSGADYSDSYEPKQNAMWQTFGGNVTIYNPQTGKADPTNLKCGFTTGDYALRYYLLNGEPFFKETHNDDKPTNPHAKQMEPQVFKLRSGEVVRFRLLNACSDLMMPVQVEQHAMYLLAMDGNNFDAPEVLEWNNNVPQVTLGPANRAEFLIKGGKPGKYRILQLEQTQQFLVGVQKTIAVIEVSGTPVNMKIPRELPPIRRDAPIEDHEIKKTRYFVFSSEFPGVRNPVVGIDFYVNNQLYDEFAVPTTVFLNQCEEWHIIVPSGEHGGTEGHPFHIHVNDFEVKSIAGIKQRRDLIQDTIWVQQNTASVIRMRFKEWTGKSVFHCHILPHEDTGMMQNFLILPDVPAMDMSEKSMKSLKLERQR